MKCFISLSFCFVLCSLFSPVNAYADEGTITFTGAIVEPPCTTKTEAGLDNTISCYSSDGNHNIKLTEIINKGFVENKVATFSHTSLAKGNSVIIFVNYN